MFNDFVSNTHRKKLPVAMSIGYFVFMPTLANLTCRKAAKAKKTDELVHGEKNSTLRWQVLRQEFFLACLK